VHAQNYQEATDGDSGQLARIRLICLACSQENLERYRSWTTGLNDHIELVAVDVQREAECVPGTLLQPPTELAHALASRLQVFLDKPHALFGHDLGAHMAFQVAQVAEGLYPDQTRRLFVSSCDSPDAPPPGLFEAGLKTPVTALYPPGALTRMLGWHAFARRELELIELPEHAEDASHQDLRLIRIFNTHLGLLGF